jgi:predicted RNA-binding Zn ribbon-like protein
MVSAWKFHLGAGSLCLDFANTVSWRRSNAPIERLDTVADLASWSRQVGLITRSREQAIIGAAARHARQSSALLRDARRLREAIFEVLGSVSEGGPAPGEAFEQLQDWIHEAIGRSRLHRVDDRYRWKQDQHIDLRDVLHSVALSCEALLRSDDVARIGRCSGRDCRWLWIDRTKNRSRRWCDMAVCGNRTKVHRYHQRQVQRATHR